MSSRSDGIRYVRGEPHYSAAWLDTHRLFAEKVEFADDEFGWTMVVLCELGEIRFRVAAHEVLSAVRPLQVHSAEGEAARTEVPGPTLEDLEVAGKPSLEGWEQ